MLLFTSFHSQHNQEQLTAKLDNYRGLDAGSATSAAGGGGDYTEGIDFDQGGEEDEYRDGLEEWKEDMEGSEEGGWEEEGVAFVAGGDDSLDCEAGDGRDGERWEEQEEGDEEGQWEEKEREEQGRRERAHAPAAINGLEFGAHASLYALHTHSLESSARRSSHAPAALAVSQYSACHVLPEADLVKVRMRLIFWVLLACFFLLHFSSSPLVMVPPVVARPL